MTSWMSLSIGTAKMVQLMFYFVIVQFLFKFAQGQGPGFNKYFNISENRPPGTQVGYVGTSLSYTYTTDDTRFHTYFNLDQNTGRITTKVSIDRESLIGARENTFSLLVIARHTTEGNHPIEVHIEILDENDVAPVFTNQSTVITIRENTNVGHMLKIETATDQDDGKNALINTYRIISGDGPFSLVYDPNIYGQVLFLTTTGAINREEVAQYSLIIQAEDSGTPRLSGTTTLNIIVEDENDNSPVFDPSNYFASVNETDEVGTLVRRVHATDKDIGKNQEIIYEFHNPNSETDQFTIDPNTGEIRTAVRPLTCQSNGQCDLSIVARDQGTPSYSGRAFVYVTIIDTNNHDPEITVKYVPSDSNGFSSVNEDAANGNIVAGITVTDKDDGINGQTTARIIAGNELRHFVFEAFDSQKYTIRVNGDGVLDRERYHVYNLTVEARDKGNPPRISTKDVVIFVNDINDFAPVFVNKRVELSISETTPVGSFIASMHATDQDTGINAKLTYNIESGNIPDWFHIDAATGLITTKTRLRYEIAYSFTMNISVQDGAINPFRDYATLKVTIWDENDMPPTFNSTTFFEELDENLGSVSPVVLATAVDNDSGLNGSLVYSFHPHVELLYPNTFHLDTTNGEVTTKKSLDRETVPEYTIRVIAKDRGPAPLTSTATVFLKVNDLNDNAPVFYPDQYFVKVFEGQSAGLEVTRVTATDRDAGLNAEITYSFSGSYSQFAINAKTGVITTTGTLHKDAASSFMLNVIASDRAQQLDTAQIQVTVLSVLDKEPTFTKGNYTFSNIPEDPSTSNVPTYVGSQIGQVTATSDALGSVINYFIVDGNKNDIFSIDRNSGWIRRDGAVDREMFPEFKLKVIAKVGTKFAECYVHITVQDANDNAPKFDFPEIDIDLIENWPVGHLITVIQAVDVDAPGPNSQVSYSLQNDHNGMFALQSDTGVLFLNKPMEMLDTSRVTLTVIARDAGSQAFTSTQKVNLVVKDVNNHTPRFQHTQLEKSLIESHPVNSRFLLVNAVDNDTGENGRLTYNITRGNEDKAFGIFPDGYLFIARELDREVKDLYKLSVVAHDHGRPLRSSECNITVHITDSNDNKPIFLNATYMFTVPENRRAGSYVGQVMASDADMGRNSDVTYAFLEKQTYFRIDAQTGEIYSLMMFDREIFASTDYAIVFDVVARDNGLERLEDVATVRVAIQDVNDNAPVFRQAVYKVGIFENAPTFSNVTVVKADDLDSGANSIITYAIIDGNDEDHFFMNQFTGQISLNQQLDRETEDYFQLTILATDSGTNIQFNDTCIVQITVKDINDNFPMFAQTQLDSSVKEDEKPGYILGHFTATDIDLGVNAEITYTLSGIDNDGSFGIDAHTGKIYLLKKLDYETKKLYRLNVTATDNGVPQLPYYVRFSITVEDVNDNRPVFRNEPILCSVTEHTTGSVCTVLAEDADSDKNAEVVYRIIHQDPPGDQFKIVRSSGQIYIDREVDREKADLFTLRVAAVDQAEDPSQRLTTETLVTISVTDINDNNPQITSFNAIAVPLSTASNSYITSIIASDKDAEDNGRVALQLLQSGGSTFSLESGSGRLLLSRQLPDNPLKYPVTIQAHDYGSPSQRTIQFPITILVTNNINQGPVFQDTPYVGSINENDGLSTILSVKAASRHNSAVEYYITNITQKGAQVGRHFVIDKVSGALKPNGALDHEVVGSEFEVEIYAIDTDGSTPRTSSTVVSQNLNSFLEIL